MSANNSKWIELLEAQIAFLCKGVLPTDEELGVTQGYARAHKTVNAGRSGGLVGDYVIPEHHQDMYSTEAGRKKFIREMTEKIRAAEARRPVI